MSNVLVPQVGFAGTTTTHLLQDEWSYVHENWTYCGLRATAVGYYQIGMAEVTCFTCISTHGENS